MCDLSWLPPSIPFEDDGSGFLGYVERLYSIYTHDFLFTHPVFRGLPVRVSPDTAGDGKREHFWHVITGDSDRWKPTGQREIKLARCATLPWMRAIIDASGTTHVKSWSEWLSRKRETRWMCALEDFSHLVVLVERKTNYIALTSYPVDGDHQRRKLRHRFEGTVGQKS